MQNGSFEVATVLQPLAQGAEAAAGGFRAQRRVRNAPFGAEAATVSQPLLEGAEAAWKVSVQGETCLTVSKPYIDRRFTCRSLFVAPVAL